MATEKVVMAVIKATRPDFRKPHDKVAFAIHASFLAAGFSLAATARKIFSDDLPPCEEEVGIDGWNELEDSYGLLYFKKDKGVNKRVLVKCHAIGDLLAVDVLNLDEEQEPFHLKIKIMKCCIRTSMTLSRFSTLVFLINWKTRACTPLLQIHQLSRRSGALQQITAKKED